MFYSVTNQLISQNSSNQFLTVTDVWGQVIFPKKWPTSLKKISRNSLLLDVTKPNMIKVKLSPKKYLQIDYQY